MRKALAILCALSLSLLAGCAVTSPKDEKFQKDWVDSVTDSMEDAAEDWAQDWEAAFDEAARAWSTQGEDGEEKDHYWIILDAEDNEAGTLTEEEQTRLVDDLLNDDGHWGDRIDTENPGAPAYSYIYCQQETLKAGQKEEDRKYEELVRFTVSAEKDVVTLVILEDLPSLLNVDLGDLLTFTVSVPAETAEALRNPGQFLE